MVLSPTSTILKVDIKDGSGYLKSPILGSSEASITQVISLSYPQDTVEVLATSIALYSFVTRGFGESEATKSNAFEISMQMDLLQKASIAKVEELNRAGLETRGPLQMALLLRFVCNSTHC